MANRKSLTRIILLFVTIFFCFSISGKEKTLGVANGIPESFVSLAEVDPSIIIEMRYAGSYNFTGRVVPGYAANKCYLLKGVAKALKRAQQKLLGFNKTLKLYDCYRPQMAVSFFMRWAKDLSDTVLQQEFYPNIKKQDLIKKGYIAKRSGHSRGDSIDVTVVDLPAASQPEFDINKQQSCTADRKTRYLDNSLDMGSGYDCFDTQSHTESPNVSVQRLKNRRFLKQILEAEGFKNYKKEWWHFTYKGKVGKKKFHNFVIE